MAEYLGYQGRPEPVNWLKIAQGAITDIDAIETDRQKQRESLEKSADDLVTASKEYKPGQSGSFNELILNGADRVRSTTLDLKKQLMNGQITPTEYKARVGRMSEDWKYLGEFSKSYNDIIAKQIEYLNDPKASKLGEFFLDKQSKLADVANKQLVVDPSTNGVVMTDPDTGMVVDFKSMLIPENQTPERLDVISEVERFTKGLGETSKYVNGIWTTSPILKDANEYQKAKANFTKSLMQSPRGAASILADYVGGYEFYETPQQKKEIEAAGGKAIQLVAGPNGIVTPRLTKAQEDEARAVLDRLVDSRVDVEKEQPRPVERASSSTSGSGSGGGGDVNVNNRRELVNRIYNDPDSYRQYILNQPLKINNKDVQVVSVKPLEGTDKNRNPLKGIEVDVEYDFVDPKTGKTKTIREPLTRSGDDAKRLINDLLNATLTPGQSISYEQAFFNNQNTTKRGVLD
jgi:hypothetical protein